MCHSTTTGHSSGLIKAILALLVVAIPALAQVPAPPQVFNPDWRRIGGTEFEASLASPASGPVERVWYADDGSRLFIRTASGRVFVTLDFEQWEAVTDSAAAPASISDPGPVSALPESGASVRSGPAPGYTIYALGRAVYRSEDGGQSWVNLTEFRGESLIGSGLADLAVSPLDEDELVVVGRYGAWRSVDGGSSWSGLNGSLPNLPARRLSGLPGGGRGARLELEGFGEFEWSPGERIAWRPLAGDALHYEIELRAAWSQVLGETVTAVGESGDILYAGTAEGRLWASLDGGGTWRAFGVSGAGPVERIHVISGNPRAAVAVLGPAPAGDNAAPRVVKTANGGLFWDDLTANLPVGAVHGVTADPVSGAVYVASDAGVFFSIVDIRGADPGVDWMPITRDPDGAPVYDVRLDQEANQLYIAVDGAGVFATTAPHRLLFPAVVNAADLRSREAAPGALMSVLGGELYAAAAGTLDVPILAAEGGESQIQIPFEVGGTALSLALTTSGVTGAPRQHTLGVPLSEASPAIFIDRDGTPMILDADSGVLLDAMTQARPGSRIQILATGLGRVAPPWPSGLPAPLDDPPSVISPVRVFLDRAPVETTRATLAPGYVGFYLIEFVVPDIVNAGPAELYLEVAGASSNRTRIYLEP